MAFQTPWLRVRACGAASLAGSFFSTRNLSDYASQRSGNLLARQVLFVARYLLLLASRHDLRCACIAFLLFDDPHPQNRLPLIAQYPLANSVKNASIHHHPGEAQMGPMRSIMEDILFENFARLRCAEGYLRGALGCDFLLRKVHSSLDVGVIDDVGLAGQRVTAGVACEVHLLAHYLDVAAQRSASGPLARKASIACAPARRD
jgi:hypothetical protein